MRLNDMIDASKRELSSTLQRFEQEQEKNSWNKEKIHELQVWSSPSGNPKVIDYCVFRLTHLSLMYSFKNIRYSPECRQ